MPETAESSHAAFAKLKELLVESTGLNYYADRDQELRTIFAKRQAAVGARTLQDYLHVVRDSPAAQTEMDLLVEEVTIGETYFFRHEELFDALRSVAIPEILERNARQRQIRIWSAGSSIGAELYTLAIILRREFAAETAGWNVSLVGTDINREFLRRARTGHYADWALRNMNPVVREECFTRAGRQWVLKPVFKQDVTFQHHNLVTHPYPSIPQNLYAFDLILCRNVMIYFDRPTIARIVGGFRESLVRGGWLAVGHAEPNTELFGEFEVVLTRGASLYHHTGKHQVISRVLQMAPLTPARPPAPAPYTPPLINLPAQRPREGSAAPPPSPTPAEPQAQSSELEQIRALADGGAIAEAAQRCEQMIESERLNPQWYFLYALFVEQLGALPVAREAFRRAIYLDRNHALAHYHLGLLEQRAGRPGTRDLRNALSVLTSMPDETILTPGDSLTAGDLREMARFALDLVTA